MDGLPRAVTSAYGVVLDWLHDVSALGSAQALFIWDRDTLMAPGSSNGRAQVMASLAGMSHQTLLRNDVEPALVALEELPDLPKALDASLREIRRQRRRSSSLSEDLVRRIAAAQNDATAAWADARPNNDFAAYAAALEPLIQLKREEAERLDIGDEPYDGLLDQFEPGARAATIEPVLADLRTRLVAVLRDIPHSQPPPVPGSWSESGQLALAHDVAVGVGYDVAHGAIAVSAHPFSMRIHAGDVRVTTRSHAESPLDCLLALLHECGHAMYDQGVPDAFAGLPIEEPPSLGAHESQSRFWENHVGRSAAFWTWIVPLIERHFPDQDASASAALMHQAATAVCPSLVRTASDEVTYNLHFSLRFELEVGLIRGTLEVQDLPEAWSANMQDLLGIRPSSDRDGVMQDIHWPEGLVGYFPTYALGNLYAAQLAATFEREHGSMDARILAGDFATILDFLRRRVHAHGGIHHTAELMQLATGEPLSSDAFIDHVRRRYLPQK
jgi:carboxypeptidase Taq